MEKQTELIDVTGDKKQPAKIKQVVKKPKQEIAIQSETSALLKLAIDKDLDVDKLEKLIDLKNREEERACKREFETHFSAMKSELPTINKSVEATDKDGKVMYKFAPLEELQTVCDPIITQHGFSYYWEESYIESTNCKRVTFFLSGYGYTRSNYFDAADIPTNTYANAIQVSGIKTSFGKRYSYQSGLGLIVKGEDNDAIHLSFNDAVEYSEQITWMKTCESKADLLKVFKQIVEDLKLKNDVIGKGVLTEVYTDMKKELK